MSSGLSPTGFTPKTFEEIQAEIISEYQNIFGTGIITTPASPQGQEVAIWSLIASTFWEQLLNLYVQYNLNSATGVSLDQLVALIGVFRKEAFATKVNGTLTGANGTVIPQASLASTLEGNVFSSDEEVTIPLSGTIDVGFTANVTGEIPAGAGTLTVIDSPIAGWATVNNIADGILGAPRESDGALRERAAQSAALPASNIIDSLYAALFSLLGLKDVVIFNNPTDEVSPEGTPAHRYLTIVDGGDQDEIANAIYLNHTSGDKSFGDLTVEVINSRGFTIDIQFSRPVEVEIYINLTLVTDATFPVDGVAQVQQAIIDYANGEFSADVCTGGFKISENVIYSRLYTPINSVCGHEVQEYTLGIAPAPTGTVDVVLAFNEVARFDASRIIITVI